MSLAFQIVHCWKETGYVSLDTALTSNSKKLWQSTLVIITADCHSFFELDIRCHNSPMKKMPAANNDLLICKLDVKPQYKLSFQTIVHTL